MVYTAILVQAEPGQEARARLKCAADLADRFDALLIGLGAEAFGGAPFADALTAIQAEWLVSMRDQVEADLRAAEQMFRESAGSRRSQWRTRRIMPHEAMSLAARAADLIVAGGFAGRGRGDYLSADVSRLVIGAGRPVLVAPPTGDCVLGKAVLVAWRDTRESRRALADAMPFLKQADRVLVAEATSADDLPRAQEATAEVATALGLHGVAATSEAFVLRGEPSRALIDRARAFGADLIVAGAYGHSRVGEMALGGVTQDLLKQDEMFVLLSH